MDILLSIFVQFAELAGVAALIAAVVNVLKAFGLVKDGTAGQWMAGLNLVALAVLVALHYFAPEIGLPEADAFAAKLAQILLIVLGYVLQLGVGQAAHGVMSSLDLPGIGYSYSRPKG